MQSRQNHISDIPSRLLSVFLIAAVILALLSGCERRDPQISGQRPTEGPSEQISDQLPTEEPSEQITDQLPTENLSGQIFLYGEQHSNERILEEEFQLWYTYYHEEGMRHLFVENSYYGAEFLNLWMQSDSDDILDQLWEDIQGTAGGTQESKAFYQRIKEECPETIFHGTDVGHQYRTTGARYLAYLESVGQEDSEAYTLAQEAIEQGKYYYRNNGNDDVYRENTMVENFIREYDKLGGADIMGIYGAAHTHTDYMDASGTIPCMAAQLAEYYGTALHTEDLTLLRQPIRIDTIEVGGKTYEASYFGERDMTSFSTEYQFREYWRLENAYDDFKDYPTNGEVLRYSNYPMQIEVGQVLVIDYTKTDGTVDRRYYRTDGNIWNGNPTTEELTILP